MSFPNRLRYVSTYARNYLSVYLCTHIFTFLSGYVRTEGDLLSRQNHKSAASTYGREESGQAMLLVMASLVSGRDKHASGARTSFICQFARRARKTG